MSTLELIQAQLPELDESNLQQIYAFIQALPASAATRAKPGILSKLRQVQIDAPADFAENLDQYLNQDHNAANALS